MKCASRDEHNFNCYCALIFAQFPISNPLFANQQNWQSIICLLLLISMLWHRQAILKSKGDKWSSSAECMIRTWKFSELLTKIWGCWIYVKQLNNRCSYCKEIYLSTIFTAVIIYYALVSVIHFSIYIFNIHSSEYLYMCYAQWNKPISVK